MRTTPRLGMATLLSVIVIGFFMLGSWWNDRDSNPAAADPLAWQAEYQDSLWGPLQRDNLTLGGIDAVLGLGNLWMISADDQPALVSRYSLQSDGQSWRLQAVISLSQEQMDSLVVAQAWEAGMRDQAVSQAVGLALGGQPVQRMSMIPAEPVPNERIIATFGNADMRMDVDEEAGDQAWVYGRAGAVVAVTGEQAHSIMFGLRGGL